MPLLFAVRASLNLNQINYEKYSHSESMPVLAFIKLVQSKFLESILLISKSE